MNNVPLIDFNKRGVFNIPAEKITQNLEEMYAVFTKIKFTIFEVGYDFSRQNFIYKGSSPMFESLPKGWEAPYYNIEDFKNKDYE